MKINSTAERIKSLRREKKMTQTQLGQKLGVSRSLIQAWEDGRCTPDIDKINTMVVLFGVPAEFIYGFSDKRLNINIPNDLEFDLTKLNSNGIRHLYETYNLLINSDEYTNN